MYALDPIEGKKTVSARLVIECFARVFRIAYFMIVSEALNVLSIFSVDVRTSLLLVPDQSSRHNAAVLPVADVVVVVA